MHRILYAENAEHIFCITEAWLNDTVSDAMLDPLSCYNIHRFVRPSKNGGAVAVFINKNINTECIYAQPEFSCIECVCFDLIESDLRFLVIYRPPEHNVQLMNSICLYIESCCKDNKTLIVIGDLNCGNIDWVNHTVKGDESQVHFYNTVIGLGFTQFIDLPTRGDNILDVLLVNDPQLISNISIDEPFSTSDHATVNFKVKVKVFIIFSIERIDIGRKLIHNYAI